MRFPKDPTQTGPYNHRRWLKLEILDLESRGLHYPCSENKGADQLCGYREADLRLYFCIDKNPIFSRRSSFDVNYTDVMQQDTLILWHNTDS